MKKFIQLSHHYDDYECMWNGIEDLYINQSGEQLPPSFFFSLASFGSFCYLKTEKDDLKRMVALGDGRTKQMYKFLAPIVGFEYKHYEYKTFEKALRKAQQEIDDGYPVVLGALDMFYLSYLPKLFLGEHIPFHYVLMIGYDDEKGNIILLDCGREEPQQLSYENLQKAWDCSYPGLSKPFTLFTIRMNKVRSKEEIAKEALKEKAKIFLNPPVGFIGYKGFDKFINDLPKWKSQLGKDEYDKILFNMVKFYGTVPTIPNALRGINGSDEVTFYGGFDKISKILSTLGNKFHNESWVLASDCFSKGALVISNIKDVIVNYLTGKINEPTELPSLYNTVKEIMIKGFNVLLNEIN